MADNDTVTPEPARMDPRDLVLLRQEDGTLALIRPGADPVRGVGVARCFPWTHNDSFISVRDGEGREICLIDSLSAVKPETRLVMEEELGNQEFLPVVTAVHTVEDQFDVVAWSVETDRGTIEIQVKNAEDVRQLDDGRVLIRDHAGGVFVVRDTSSLDAKSRRIVEERVG
jgi:hypothetical protein